MKKVFNKTHHLTRIKFNHLFSSVKKQLDILKAIRTLQREELGREELDFLLSNNLLEARGEEVVFCPQFSSENSKGGKEFYSQLAE